MRTRINRTLLFELTLVLLMAFVVLALKSSAERYWLHASGAVIPSGTWTLSFADQKNIKLLSATGKRWIAQDKTVEARAYHALIILPSVPLIENGSISSNDGITETSTLKWLIEESLVSNRRNTEEYALTVTYNAVFQTVAIDSKTYSLANGNLFVIRLNEEGRPQATQLDETFTGDDEPEVREIFKRAVPNEEAIQKVL